MRAKHMVGGMIWLAVLATLATSQTIDLGDLSNSINDLTDSLSNIGINGVDGVDGVDGSDGSNGNWDDIWNDVDTDQLKNCDKYWSSDKDQAASDKCGEVAGGSKGDCPAECKDWLQGIPQECVDVMAKFWPSDTQSGLDKINEKCGTNFKASGDNNDWGSWIPDINIPNIDGIDGLDNLNDDLQDLEDKINNELDDINTGLNSNFTCDGDYSWITLDAEMASQLGGLKDSGPELAVKGDCASLFSDDAGQKPSGCCAQTSYDTFPWWQYELDEDMLVKGIRIAPPTGKNCCTDEKCDDKEWCYHRSIHTQIFVGNTSLPSLLESDDIVKEVDGNRTLSNYVVAARLIDGSTLCNQINSLDLETIGGDLRDNASIGCGIGKLTGGVGEKEPKGRYVSLIMITDESQSLAVCGIEICAKPA